MKLFETYSLFDITPERGEGNYIFDEEGVKYLDLYGGHAVISIGHSHPKYVENIKNQVSRLGFYSNAIQNPLQKELALKLGRISQCSTYNLFLCNSGAEANENALKLASFYTGKKKVIAFKNGFHGRTSAAVAVTDNSKIIAPINEQQEVELLKLGDIESVEKSFANHDVCAVIFEIIQGVGGLDEAPTWFYQRVEKLCKKYGVILIIDEVQCGFGRTGDFFAFQKHGLTPDIISMAKGMGNGFPIGGVLIHPKIKASYGMLGTTFGGNHLACAASLAVLEVLEKEKLLERIKDTADFFKRELRDVTEIKAVKGRGLMLGLVFDFPIGELRKKLLFKHHIFTGNAKNPKVLRILPPLTITKRDLSVFIKALKEEL
ncbi:aspartate aminotransferase family protein [Tenacibaculum maritimum]|uniref:aspartate aminotransferase family protein n=1 Tax=Tenacibaculum maritimum TaxID=107401 RepID=UPI0012E5BFA5|nr:aminotransferase class III-fold pyridoxal phosphate-dependent enzyme [Tenacibaculum maritimum]MCD9582004.1 aminotransferase class III-fold pyridoxal phosphate-dependent enzyme [Tenacibaculum maritimum]MCD9636520.1 aminotransferase class III-fold pyridoxal phosphate-dependent enzyme [Tenacibaculum maritimum]CAA0207758.1 Acetylornithine aminotransferase [Tenacibaculum maritimum]CAA0208153.1 Acetylornithine aminotransferase [Tenacibaculum maritimum]CAA0209939.1 Acetylornithine aminotransferase